MNTPILAMSASYLVKTATVQQQRRAWIEEAAIRDSTSALGLACWARWQDHALMFRALASLTFGVCAMCLTVTLAQPAAKVGLQPTGDRPTEQLAFERAQRDREVAIQESIGRFTGYLVLLGALQTVLICAGLLASFYAARAAKRSAELAAHGLATVRTLERARFSIERRKIEIIEDPRRIRIEFEAVNRGRSVATITRSAHGLHIAPHLPKPPAFPPWQAAPEIVQAGEATVFEITVRYESASQIREVAQKTAFLHVLGRFEYLDVFQQTHERAFVFVCDVDAETFHPPVGALGYNYET